MSVRRRTYRDPATGAVATRWMVDIDFQHPDGRRERVRKVCPVQNKRGAEQYERDVRNELLRPAPPPTAALAPAPSPEPKEVPTFKAFAKTFMATYAKANNKISEQTSKQSILDNRLLPRFGGRRLDSFTVLDLDTMKAEMLDEEYSRKSVNNTLATLSKILHYAHDLKIIPKVPPFTFLRIKQEKFDFLDFAEFERLVAAAKAEPEMEALILVGGEAGLRMGEILALSRDCIDFRSGNLSVWENDWHGHVNSPKGGDRRTIPMTDRLKAALQAIRHLRGELIFCGRGGESWTRHTIQLGLNRICRKAGLRRIGAHALRHTFCSHLAMRGAAPKAIQELAGHKSMKVTMRYMHLTQSALRDAIRLLDGAERRAASSAPDEVTAR
jgi:integrase